VRHELLEHTLDLGPWLSGSQGGTAGLAKRTSPGAAWRRRTTSRSMSVATRGSSPWCAESVGDSGVDLRTAERRSSASRSW